MGEKEQQSSDVGDAGLAPAGTLGICLLDEQGTMVRSVPLKIRWNAEAVTDLKTHHGIDAQREVFEMLFHKFLNGTMLHLALWDLLGMGPEKK